MKTQHGKDNMNKKDSMNGIVLAAVAALTAGTALADLSIARECDADEGRGTHGFFVVSRGADDPVTKPIRFIFSVAGTAKPGWTYCSLWGDETIPAGEKSVRIRIIPLDDPETKDDATVTLTLQPSTGAYTVDPAKATATLKVLNGATFGGYNRRDAGPWSLIAHRGGGEGLAPENSKAALEACVREGFGFENDLRITKDGRFYISHDAKADITGLADFRDSLSFLKPGIINLVDCKCGSSAVDKILEEIKATDALKRGGLLAFCCLDAKASRRIVSEAPGVQSWLSPGWPRGKRCDAEKEAMRIIALVKATNCQGISLGWNGTVCTKEFFDKFHEAGIDVLVWTIDDARTAKMAINLGARWVATNAPRRLTNEFPPANPL